MTNESVQEISAIQIGNETMVKDGGAKKGGGFGWGAFTFIMSVVISTIGGAAGGYYAALSIPVPNQVMVFDIAGLTKKAADMAAKGVAGGDARKVGDELLARAHKAMDEYREMGVVIIDREMVIDAPPHLIINYEDKAAQAGDGKGSSQEDMVARLKDLEKQLSAMGKK